MKERKLDISMRKMNLDLNLTLYVRIKEYGSEI